MVDQAAVFRGEDAKALLDNPLLVKAFAKVEEYINGQELVCAPDDKERAQRLVISKQLLAGIKREIQRVVENGDLAKIKIDALEKKKMLSRVFRR